MYNFRFVWIISFLLIVISCEKKEEKASSAYLEVSIDKIDNGYYYLINSEEDVIDAGRYYNAIDSFFVDSTEVIKFSIQIDAPTFYQVRKPNGFSLFYGKHLYLGPGDSLKITQIAKETDLVGTTDTLNMLQWEIREKFFEGDSVRKKYKKRRTLEPQDFIKYINKLREDQERYIEEKTTRLVIPINYRNFLEAKAHSGWISDVWDYMRYHSYYAHGEWGYLPLDSFNYDVLKEGQPDTNFRFLGQYLNSIDGYITYLYNNIDIPDSLQWETEMMDRFNLIKRNLYGMDQDMALLKLSDKFWQYLTALQSDFYSSAQEIDNYFLNSRQSDRYYNIFSSNLGSFLKIAPGQRAPNFTLEDSAGNDMSLSDLKGKVVYITFWGTWCPPCIASIPKYLELQERFKDDNVVFLYIALEGEDKDIERWKKFIADREFAGTHWVAENQFHNEQLKPYKLSAVPTFILIDQQGNIVSPRANGADRIINEIKDLL